VPLCCLKTRTDRDRELLGVIGHLLSCWLLHKILQEQQLLSNILLLGGCSASRCNTVFLNFKNK
jgi:hypothetical protein